MAPHINKKLANKSPLNLRQASEMIYNIRDKNRKFRMACSQILQINNTIDENEVRYRRALTNNAKCYRYILRLKLCTLEGVRNQFYDYAYAKADELESLQLELWNKHGIVWSEALESESDRDSDDESS